MADKIQVTAEWLARNATLKGGYTKRQFAIIGIEWPPTPGWKARAIGLEMSAIERSEFEAISNASKA